MILRILSAKLYIKTDCTTHYSVGGGLECTRNRTLPGEDMIAHVTALLPGEDLPEEDLPGENVIAHVTIPSLGRISRGRTYCTRDRTLPGEDLPGENVIAHVIVSSLGGFSLRRI